MRQELVSVATVYCFTLVFVCFQQMSRFSLFFIVVGLRACWYGLTWIFFYFSSVFKDLSSFERDKNRSLLKFRWGLKRLRDFEFCPLKFRAFFLKIEENPTFP